MFNIIISQFKEKSTYIFEKTFITEQIKEIVWRDSMDRRQKKTRAAIFNAFCSLLAKKHYNHITVGEIIELADVGRATFYAHFETKDFLLKELCSELFCHIFDATNADSAPHEHIFKCDAPSSVLLHLFQHLQRNDKNILELLSCQNNELFLRYFKEGLKELIARQPDDFSSGKPQELPESFWIDHVAATLVEAIRWWIENGMKESPEVLARYCMLAL